MSWLTKLLFGKASATPPARKKPAARRARPLLEQLEDRTTPSNVAPSFTPGPDVTVNEDAGASTIAAWATNLSPGPSEEASQVLDFQVEVDNPALFSVAPAIDAQTGDLTFTPAADANGIANVTVRLHDDGGTADGGVDTSDPVYFLISVNAVNDAPDFTAVDPPAVDGNSGLVSVPIWSSFLAGGGADEAGQSPTYIVSNVSNPSLFTTAPQVSPDGTLTYTLAANANGTSTFDVQVQDSGGTTNGGMDSSVVRTFTITATVPVNPALQANDDEFFDSNYSVNLETGALTISAPGILTNDQGVANPSLIVSLVTTTAYGGLILNDDGSFSYTPSVPKAQYPGSDFFIYQIDDGVNVATATVFIHVDDPYHTDWKEKPPAGAPAEGGRVIQEAGRFEFAGESIVFITNNTVSGDSFAIWWQGGSPRHTNIANWQALVDILNGLPDGSLQNIYISGHGAWGGISSQGDQANWLMAANLTDAQAAVIRRKLAQGGRVILLGCGQGSMTETGDLARKIGAPVVGNTGCVSDGNYGDGQWVQFDP